MIVVIIAGGAGTRLWPLSSPGYPKHLLRITDEDSLLQNTYKRVKLFANEIFVVSEASHIEHVYEQLPDLPKKNILVEPARKGTASCVILALSEMEKQKYEDQPILFLWADHLVRDKAGFVSSAKQAAKLADSEKKLVFMGIEPTYPSTGLGYIQKAELFENGPKNVYKLNQFVEKPDKKTAKHYFQSGEYLWNTGYLTGNIQTFKREIKQHSPRLWNDYSKLMNVKDPNEVYEKFVSEPIDTALSENVDEALVILGTFDWLDVGSFQDLHKVALQDDEGNLIEGKRIAVENVTHSYIRNDQKLPIAVIGLDNVAVIATDNGILVTNKTHAQRVGEVSKRINGEKN